MRKLFLFLTMVMFFLTSCDVVKLKESSTTRKEPPIRLVFSLPNSSEDFDNTLYTVLLYDGNSNKIASEFLKNKRIGYYKLLPRQDKIVVGIHYDAASFEYYVINIDGSAPERLTLPVRDGIYPVWSDDGEYIYGISPDSLNAKSGYIFSYDVNKGTFEKYPLESEINSCGKIKPYFDNKGVLFICDNKINYLNFENKVVKPVYSFNGSVTYGSLDKSRTIFVLNDEKNCLDVLDGNNFKIIKTYKNILKYKFYSLDSMAFPDGEHVIFKIYKYDDKGNFIGAPIVSVDLNGNVRELKESDNLEWNSVKFISERKLAGVSRAEKVLFYDLNSFQDMPYMEMVLCRNNEIGYLKKLKIALPNGWKEKFTGGNEVYILNSKDEINGGIYVISYYKDQYFGGFLPNHSELLKEEDIKTPIGEGKIAVLRRSPPAASNDPATYIEIFGIIPIADNDLAYCIWLGPLKDDVKTINEAVRIMEYMMKNLNTM
ncbi:hypothetical protein SAMN04244560_00948 [Thermoanaerobacter thermohydrosulfuricus]|uniref:TolB protein n=1 Tax=Thermoanaerobacter thermohydrosulfuricus TaxID=1516 RepID=A0A1G7MCR5_THETY|nr:hypothetical protein [Thermoanaerobacter thermohydrosulfuricus]SDF59475.1 hypothetical protein SAMN04244560_00948 [Thermoanaerobacter thermohydrosulfuricus]HHW57591.1 hypothetical protein [Clostridia bacterium]